MRLHNRQIKATFWNDPQLLEWPWLKRIFYIGLSQLADDSGCLEESALAFKANLFPVDQEIGLPEIRRWVDELVEGEKLVRYEVGGKPCLYMRTFHRHQSLSKGASPPSVPLPPWISWTPFPSNPRAGRYIVSEGELTEYLHVSDVALTHKGGPSFQHEHEHEAEPETPLTGLAAPASQSDLEKVDTDPLKAKPRDNLARALEYDPVAQIVCEIADELHDPRPPPELYQQVLGIFKGDRMPHADKAALLYRARSEAKRRVWSPETRKKRGPPGAPNRVPDFVGALKDLVVGRREEHGQQIRDGPD